MKTDKMARGTVCFVSGNADKVREAAAILGGYGIKVSGRAFEFEEISDPELEHVAAHKARQAMRSIPCPFIVDDAGIFFNAFRDFPGSSTKQVFRALGYKGILKLLANERRTGYFKSVIAYVDRRKKLFVFTGICRGRLSRALKGPCSPHSPFNRLFIPEGGRLTFAQIGLSEQIKISHRAQALRQFAEFYLENNAQRRK